DIRLTVVKNSVARQALDEVVPLPPTIRFNVLDRIEAAVDEWQPFAMTWHPIYDDD
ncbi:hypothetical protein LCGC14_3142540, partial [marine sediment metagenome]